MTRRIIYTLVRAAPLLLLGLAPGGGYLAANIAACAGGLLHHHFTLTPSPLAPLPKGEGKK